MAAQRLEIEIDLATGEIKGSLKDVEAALGKTGKKAQTLGSKIEKSLGGAFKKIGSQLLKVGALFASIFSGATLFASIRAANKQEDAVNQLRGALDATNTATEKNINLFKDLAAEMERTTQFGDEVIINQIALAKSMGATGEQAAQIAIAAADLAVAMDMDIGSATRNLTKTLSGLSGELGESVSELRGMDQAALRAGRGIDAVAKKFAGRASKALNTFRGQSEKVQNSLGSVLEQLGFIITKNPAIISGLTKIGATFSKLAVFIEANRDAIIGLLNKGFDALVRFAKDSAIPNLLKIFDFFSKHKEILLTAFSVAILAKNLATVVSVMKDLSALQILGTFGKVAGAVAAVALLAKGVGEKLGKAAASAFNPKTIQGQIDRLEESARAIRKVGENAKKTEVPLDRFFGTLFGGTKAEKARVRIEKISTEIGKLKDRLAAGQTLLTEGGKGDFLGSMTKDIEDLTAAFADVGKIDTTAIQKIMEKIKNSFTGVKETVEGSKEVIVNYGAAIQSTLVALGSFIGKQLAGQENAWDGFKAAILNIIGDMAIAIGTTLIGIGLGIEALKASLGTLTGGIAVAAGVALVATGVFLKVAAGKLTSAAMGAASGSSGSSAGSNVGFDETVADPSNVEDRSAGVSTQVVIQGDVIDDGTATAHRILDLLNEHTDNTGATFTGAFA